MTKQYPKSFRHAHDPESIRKRLKKGSAKSYLKDFVYGALDGTVTTFAVVSGVEGADLQTKAILILGAANLFADGFSMAASNFLGTKTENQERALAKDFEKSETLQFPENEQNEIRQILRKHGYSGELLKQNLEFIISDRNRWVNTMLAEEYGISGLPKPPMKAALVTFLAFIAFGSIPLLTYIFGFINPFFWASFFTAISFILIGSLKSKWTIEHPVGSAMRTLLLGASASSIAYAVGATLRHFI